MYKLYAAVHAAILFSHKHTKFRRNVNHKYSLKYSLHI